MRLRYLPLLWLIVPCLLLWVLLALTPDAWNDEFDLGLRLLTLALCLTIVVSIFARTHEWSFLGLGIFGVFFALAVNVALNLVLQYQWWTPAMSTVEELADVIRSLLAVGCIFVFVGLLVPSTEV